jgi:hypothetical protein
MSFRLNRNLAITFLFSLALLLALAGSSSATALSPDSPRRRDHLNLNRMIKIRAPAPPVARQHASNNPAVNAAGANAAEDSSTPSTPSSTPSSPSASNTPQASSAAPASQSVASPSSSVSDPAVQSASSTQTHSSQSSASSTASTQSATSSASTSSPPTLTATPSAQKDAQVTTTNGASPSVDSVTYTSHIPAASSSSSPSDSQLGASSLSHTTITILIVLAASIGGCAIVWTIIRKWKFRPSAQFEDRLEPVNWQPAEHESDGSGLPTHRKVPSNASSFHSAGHDNMMGLSRNNSGSAYNAGRSLTPLPDHDFTAGAAALAPGAGYADLARGPSPQPSMQEALHRGPSFNQGYNDYAAPAYYQGGQEAYDHGGPRY